MNGKSYKVTHTNALRDVLMAEGRGLNALVECLDVGLSKLTARKRWQLPALVAERLRACVALDYRNKPIGAGTRFQVVLPPVKHSLAFICHWSFHHWRATMVVDNLSHSSPLFKAGSCHADFSILYEADDVRILYASDPRRRSLFNIWSGHLHLRIVERLKDKYGIDLGSQHVKVRKIMNPVNGSDSTDQVPMAPTLFSSWHQNAILVTCDIVHVGVDKVALVVASSWNGMAFIMHPYSNNIYAYNCLHATAKRKPVGVFVNLLQAFDHFALQDWAEFFELQPEILQSWETSYRQDPGSAIAMAYLLREMNT